MSWPVWLPVWLRVGIALARELVRAIAFPLHLVLYLPARQRWRTRARAALEAAAQPTPPQDGPLLPPISTHGRRPRLFVSAGETSGEVHAANVVRALRAQGVDAECLAFGGPLLESAGAHVRVPLSAHSIIGLGGVLRALPFLVKAVADFVRLLRVERPDLVLLVDYPGLHLVLGQLAREHRVPVVHYVAPQYWAWAPWRMARYRRCVDATLTILPFEPAFFEGRGLAARYAGHPLLDHYRQHPPVAAELAAVCARPTVCLMPGSRRAEIEQHLAPFVAIARRLHRDDPNLRFVIPHVDPRRARQIEQRLAGLDAPFIELRVGAIGAWLAGARAVLVKSGTGSLEACLHGTPSVVVYKLSGRSWQWMHRNALIVPWVAAANLVANAPVVPEHVFFDDDGWAAVEESLRALLRDGETREACVAGLAAVRRRLGGAGASERVARWLAATLASPAELADSELEPYRDLAPEDADAALRTDPELAVLDVRTPPEHARHRLPGSQLIPVHELPRRLDELDPARRYLVVCEHGVRSVAACELLVEHGFAAIANLNGGMAHWLARGLPVERGTTEH